MKKVLCINAENSRNMLKKGEIYEVLEWSSFSRDISVYLIRYSECKCEWFTSDRFKIIK